MEKSIRLMDGQIYRGKNNSIFHYCEGKLIEHKPSSLRTCFCIGCFSKLCTFLDAGNKLMMGESRTAHFNQCWSVSVM